MCHAQIPKFEDDLPKFSAWTSPQSEPESKAKRTPKFIPRSTSGCVARVCTLYPWSGFRIPASPGPRSEVDFLWYDVRMYIMKNIYRYLSDVIWICLFIYMYQSINIQWDLNSSIIINIYIYIIYHCQWLTSFNSHIKHHLPSREGSGWCRTWKGSQVG